ncbi:calcium/sodium antiporter [Luteolibacter algae]|uniref:Calcium/sodium antiporter n=1 Tax=Luteolibacter algae TaxID=454151 RepID=A0ABW5D6U3_9BACT
MFLIIIGGLLLFFGAEGLVRGSASLALRLGVHPLIAGLTVVAFGTSAPELSVSVSAALEGRGGIAIGNIVGSNIFNIAVILGIASLINPLGIHLDILKRDIPVLIGTSLVGMFLIASGNVTRVAGILLVIGLLIYLFFTIKAARKSFAASGAPPGEVDLQPSKSILIDLVFVAGGLALLVYGSGLFVDGATFLAKKIGISDAIIGLTIVAAGTSLPELATSVVAAFRKQSDIAIGNVVGSNIFNILCILGLTASVSGDIDSSGFELRDGLVMLGLSCLLLPFSMSGMKISRWEGSVLLLCYLGYLMVLWPR